MFCAPKQCVMSPESCLYNKQIALQAIEKLLQGRTISFFEIDRVVAFKKCKLGNHDLAETAIQALFGSLIEKLERSRI